MSRDAVAPSTEARVIDNSLARGFTENAEADLCRDRPKADLWGRKALFLLGFAARPIRGVLFALWDHPAYLPSIQLLDGVGAGIFGALFFIVIADLTEGSGHYDLALGAATAADRAFPARSRT